jgi:hypothetical protein
MAEYVMTTFSSPLEGREDGFNRWYTSHHLGAMVAVPGVRSAQRFQRRIHVAGEAQPPYLTIYEFDARTPEEFAATQQNLKNANLELGDTADHAKTVNVVFELAGPRLGSGRVGSFRLMALTNAAEGRHNEFNEWYNTVHMQEALAVPGFSTAERFRRHKQNSGQPTPQYMALYGLDADSAEAAGAILKGLGSAKLARSDSMAPGGAVMSFFEVISEKVMAPQPALG